MSGSRKPEGADAVSRLGALSRLPWSMIDMLAASFFINVLSLALPITLLQVYDRILPNEAHATLTLLLVGVAGALLAEMVLRLLRSYLSGWIGARFEHLAGCSAFRRATESNLAEFERDGEGVHLERMNALNTLKDFYAGQAILTLFDLPFAVVFLTVIAYLAGTLVLVPIILITLFAASAMWIGRRLRKALHTRMTQDDRRFDFIIEVLGGIHTVKALALETQMLRRYERLQEASAEGAFDVGRSSAAAQNLGSIFAQLTLFSVVGIGSIYVIDGYLTVGGLAACTLLSGRAMQPLQRAVGIWTRFQTIQLARERVRQLFALQPETTDGLPTLRDVAGHIEMRDVHFRYRKDTPDILNGATMHVLPGEVVGISGGNASGKSTLLFLMLGLLRPTAGQSFIDGHDMSEIDIRSLRGRIAYLPQHGVLFNGTILQNITMFRPELEAEGLEVARQLGLDSVVAHMAMGYETKVGDGATDALPKGIKQRIAIARALATGPKVLLFDEANASMDGAGDNILRTMLEQMKGHVTLVMVSCRPSMLKLCDRVYDLAGGVLAERRDAPKAAPPRAPAVLQVSAGPPSRRASQQTPPAGAAGKGAEAPAEPRTPPSEIIPPGERPAPPSDASDARQ